MPQTKQAKRTLKAETSGQAAHSLKNGIYSMEPIKIVVNSSVFDLATFENVAVERSGSFVPSESLQDALNRMGGDSAKLLSIVNDGLESVARKELRDASGDWFVKDEETQVLTKFEGTAANEDAVFKLATQLARSIFGFNKDMSVEQKRESKQKAMDMIKNNADIRNGLQQAAAIK